MPKPFIVSPRQFSKQPLMRHGAPACMKISAVARSALECRAVGARSRAIPFPALRLGLGTSGFSGLGHACPWVNRTPVPPEANFRSHAALLSMWCPDLQRRGSPVKIPGNVPLDNIGRLAYKIPIDVNQKPTTGASKRSQPACLKRRIPKAASVNMGVSGVQVALNWRESWVSRVWSGGSAEFMCWAPY